MEISYALDDLPNTSRAVWESGKGCMVWAFHGEMGSGKTTFIHELCKQVGVTSATSSPTYSIINEYQSEEVGTIYHMDWYRLKDESEAIAAGVEDCLYSGNLCLVEWPERAESLLPPDTFHISIQLLSNDSRVLIMGFKQSATKKL